MENYHPEEIRREVRQRKKLSDLAPQCCPVCGVTLRITEVEQHYAIEIDRLDKLSSASKCKKTNKDARPSTSSSPTTSTDVANQESCWGTYQKIRTNRQSRLKIKSRKRKAEDVVCPICNETTTDDINVHVEACLRKSENKSEGDLTDDESIDVEVEEYEWAGQTRIRASTLLEGGYAGVGLGTSMNSSRIVSDDDEDLNVDGDDTQIYGPLQYTERDIIPITNENKKEDSNSLYLRNLVIGNNVGGSNSSMTASLTGITINKFDIEEVDENSQPTSNNNHMVINQQNYNSINSQKCSELSIQKIVESLRNKIKDLEIQIKNKSKCLICLDEYKIPVVSICCWHVHCEECWLRTLGARKLCPQCNMITSPTDLRKIYM